MTGWRAALAYGGAAALLAGLLILSASLGAVTLPLGDVVRVIGAAMLGRTPAGVSPVTVAIVLQLRLPRVLLAAIVGAGLAVVGALVLAQRARGMERLVVAGLAMSFLFGAITDVLVFAGDQRASQSVLFWMLGGFGLARWGNLPLAAAGLAVVLAAGLGWSRRLDALLAGDETAASLGIPVLRFRIMVFLACALGTSTFVALTGVIGFVGLMVPQVTRGLAAFRHRVLIPASALLGVALMVASDLISRTLLPSQELPVGIVTAGLGAVFLLGLLLRRER